MSKKSTKKIDDGSFSIIIDNREQNPWFFDKVGHPAFPGLAYQYSTLKTGDYSIVGMSDPENPASIIIERKSLSDLFGSLGRGRKRFEAEMTRALAYDHVSLIIEGDLAAIIHSPPELSRMSPKSVFRSLIAICQRYKIAVWTCPDREFAERTAYLILRRYWEDHGTSRGKLFIPGPSGITVTAEAA